MTPIFLGLGEIITIHNDQIKRYGGAPGIRDIELLKSAVAMPAIGFSGSYLHKDLFEMAAAYLFHIAQNHPFVDGNKRVGTVAANIFLTINDIEFQATEESFEEIVRHVSEGKTNKLAVAFFFQENSK